MESGDPRQETQKLSANTIKARDELHTVTEGILQGAEQEVDIAERENVYDEQGNIIDVRFSHKGNTSTLKDILPGDYTIVFTHYSREECESNPELQGVHHPRDNTVTVNEFTDTDAQVSENKSKENLILLHEAGHAVGANVNIPEFYVASTVHQLKEYIARSMVGWKAQNMEGAKGLGSSNLDDIVSMWTDVIEKEKQLSPEAIEELHRTIRELYVNLQTHMKPDELTLFKQVKGKQLVDEESSIEEKLERTANAYALHGLRALRKKGINLYRGTLSDLFGAINTSLDNHRYVYQPEEKEA